jgi:hypothetical protein
LRPRRACTLPRLANLQVNVNAGRVSPFRVRQTPHTDSPCPYLHQPKVGPPRVRAVHHSCGSFRRRAPLYRYQILFHAASEPCRTHLESDGLVGALFDEPLDHIHTIVLGRHVEGRGAALEGALDVRRSLQQLFDNLQVPALRSDVQRGRLVLRGAIWLEFGLRGSGLDGVRTIRVVCCCSFDTDMLTAGGVLHTFPSNLKDERSTLMIRLEKYHKHGSCITTKHRMARFLPMSRNRKPLYRTAGVSGPEDLKAHLSRLYQPAIRSPPCVRS